MITRQCSTVGASVGWNFWEIFFEKIKKALSATFCGEKNFEIFSFLRPPSFEKCLFLRPSALEKCFVAKAIWFSQQKTAPIGTAFLLCVGKIRVDYDVFLDAFAQLFFRDI